MNNVSYGLIKEYKLYLKQANWKHYETIGNLNMASSWCY